MRRGLLALFFLLPSCVRSSHSVLGPGEAPGTQKVLIECNRAAACYSEASEICPNGFRLLNAEHSERAIKLGDDTTQCTGNGNNVTCSTQAAPAMNVYSGTMLVECAIAADAEDKPDEPAISEKDEERIIREEEARLAAADADAEAAAKERKAREAIPRRCESDGDCRTKCCAKLEGLAARVCAPPSKCPVVLDEDPAESTESAGPTP